MNLAETLCPQRSVLLLSGGGDAEAEGAAGDIDFDDLALA